MKRKYFIPIFVFFMVSCSGEGDIGQPCRDNENVACNGGLICNTHNICEECGDKGNLCCKSDYRNACDSGLICGSTSRCEVCGEENCPCCENRSCDLRLSCDSNNTCTACGYEDQPCCQGTQCFGSVCADNGVCTNQLCDDGGNCQPCGRIDTPCCSGDTCNVNGTCSGDGMCVSCGSLNEPACSNNQCGYWQSKYAACSCDAWFIESNGICSVPFRVDEQASIEICFPRFGSDGIKMQEVDPPSTSDNENRQWCYWYAAFYKNEPELCENISWGEMRDKCTQGENPEEYRVFIK